MVKSELLKDTHIYCELILRGMVYFEYLPNFYGLCIDNLFLNS